MSVDYDPKVLKKHSKNLYWSADLTTIIFPVLGIIVGGSVGYGMFKLVGAAAGAAIGGYAGLRYGDNQATQMRSQAQTSLCMAQIEENTRKSPQSDTTTAAKS